MPVTPKIYRSADAGAPVLFNGWGSFLDILDACLVNGYGGGFATGSITSDGVNVSDGDTVTIGSRTYTFRTTRAAINDVLIGASAAASLQNLAGTINAYNLTTAYFAGTAGHADVWAPTISATVVTLQARVAGTAGNSLVLTRSSTHLTVSGSGTLTGGASGTPKTSAGWTIEFTGPGRRVYRPGAGSRCYLDVLDNNPDTTYFGGGARMFGFETVTALGTGFAASTGSGQFGQTNQYNCVKYGSAQSLTVSATICTPWLMLADDRTFYFFYYAPAALSNTYFLTKFGDMQSLITGDTAKTFLCSCANWYTLGQQYNYEYGGALGSVGGTQYTIMQRNWSGIISNVLASKVGDQGRGLTNFAGALSLPHAPDGGLYVSPVYLIEGSSGSGVQRGIMRGVYQPLHTVTSWNDGDQIPGSGTFAGHTFLVVKPLCAGSSSPVGAMMVDIYDWPT